MVTDGYRVILVSFWMTNVRKVMFFGFKMLLSGLMIRLHLMKIMKLTADNV